MNLVLDSMIQSTKWIGASREKLTQLVKLQSITEGRKDSTMLKVTVSVSV